jgi:hypothetical protein
MQDNSSGKGFLLLIMASNQPPDQLPNTLPQQQPIPPTSMSWHGVPILWQGNGYGFPPFPFASSPYLPPHLQRPLNSPYLSYQWLGPLSSPYPPLQFPGPILYGSTIPMYGGNRSMAACKPYLTPNYEIMHLGV